MKNPIGYRAQISFVVSMILHGGVIVLIAVGPTLLNQMNNKGLPFGKDQATPVEFTTVSEPAQTLAPAAAPVTIEAPTVVEAPAPKVAKVKKVTFAKSAPVKSSTTKSVTTTEVPAIEPQPAIPAENSETPIETVVAANEVSKTEVAPAPALAEEPPPEIEPTTSATDEAFADVKTTQKTQAPQEAMKAEEAPKAVEAAPLPAPKVKGAAAEGNSAGQAVAAAATTAPAGTLADASAASGVQVTQSYTGLKQMAGNKPPSYSRDMRLQKMQGAGQLVYFVNKDGSVSQLRLTKSTGVATLDKAAVDAFSKYRFVPGQEGYTMHNFEFSLKGPTMSDSGRLRTSMK